MKKILGLAALIVGQMYGYGYEPRYRPGLHDYAVAKTHNNVLFAGGLAGTGYFMHKMADQFLNSDKGCARYFKSSKWLVPGGICFTIGMANSLRTNCGTTPKEALYKTLLPFTAVATGYYASKSLQVLNKVPSKNARLLCGVYAGLTGLSLFEIYNQSHMS
ncbi:MAG: hypothetical protein WC707_00220 [Candidatus Babeliaceae bacterium]|jgi:hypothetical protein